MSTPDETFFETFSAALRQKEQPQAAPIFAGEDDRIKAGLAVYRNNVRSSLSRALAEKFPVIHKLVGAAFFKFLAHEYFHLHPPRSPLVRLYGGKLPVFLENFAPAKSHPYLADIARLEIIWLDAYHAADARPLSPEAIAAIADDNIGGLCFIFHPSTRLLSSSFPIASIWRKNQTGKIAPNINLNIGENVVVTRPQNDVIVTTLSGGAYAALQALCNGVSLADAIEHAAAHETAFNPQAFFQLLFQLNIIISADKAGETSP